MRRFPVGRAACILVALGLAGCGAPTYRYVSNSIESTYFRVPRSWDVQDIPVEPVDRIDSGNEDVLPVWRVMLDASSEPDLVHSELLMNPAADPLDEPAGTVQIYDVTGGFNEKLSLSAARSAILGFDPLFMGDEVKDTVEIITRQPLAPNDGLQGSRVIFNFRPTVDDPWRTMDLVSAFDQSRGRLYILLIGCSGECFKREQTTISDFVSSWKVDR
jgi:hypothetical protein